MTERSEEQLDRLLAATAAEYADEERAAAIEEAEEAAHSKVFSVRLPPSVYDAVRAEAEQTLTTPSALIRQWVAERVGQHSQDDLTTAVADLRRDVERLTRLTLPAA